MQTDATKSVNRGNSLPASCGVLVVGGGPGGSSTAAALARAGVDVLVVDRAHFPRSKPCAEYLSPEASRILDSMGALKEVEQCGAAMLAGVIIRAPNGREIRGEFAAQHGFTAYRDRGISVRRERLDHILLNSAQRTGARVVQGFRFNDVIRDRTGTAIGASLVRLSDGQPCTVSARLVIGADGLRSTVANRLSLASSMRWPRRLALVTHFRGVAGIGDVAEMHVEPDGYVGIADVGEGVTTVALVIPAKRASEIAGDRAAFLRAWIGARPHLAARFADAERVSPVAATGPFASRSRRATAAGAMLVGDAADFFDPFTGEGIFAALRGGELVAQASLDYLGAATSSARARALASYDAARRDAFAGKWFVERVIAAVVGSPRLMNRAAASLSARRDLADLLIGVTGDFVPPREIIRLGFVLSVFAGIPRLSPN